MAWTLVPALQEFRIQINELCPNRDKASDGVIGDYNHQKGDSSHNPDDTGKGNAEWDSDPDGKEEVRAVDIDVDFRREGVTAQRLVNHLVKYAKNGTFWWIRYVIYNRKMYHRRNGFAATDYTGANPHDHHVHINSEFTQSSDNVSGVNYRLEELVEEVVTGQDKKDIAKLVVAEITGAMADGTALETRTGAATLNYNGGGLPSELGEGKNFLNYFTDLYRKVVALEAAVQKLQPATDQK